MALSSYAVVGSLTAAEAQPEPTPTPVPEAKASSLIAWLKDRTITSKNTWNPAWSHCVNDRLECGKPALFIAYEEGGASLATLLLENKADVNISDIEFTILKMAIMAADSSFVASLLKQHHPDAKGMLILAIERCYLPIIRREPINDPNSSAKWKIVTETNLTKRLLCLEALLENAPLKVENQENFANEFTKILRKNLSADEKAEKFKEVVATTKEIIDLFFKHHPDPEIIKFFKRKLDAYLKPKFCLFTKFMSELAGKEKADKYQAAEELYRHFTKKLESFKQALKKAGDTSQPGPQQEKSVTFEL